MQVVDDFLIADLPEVGVVASHGPELRGSRKHGKFVHHGARPLDDFERSDRNGSYQKPGLLPSDCRD
jgi:hypothetical protein